MLWLLLLKWGVCDDRTTIDDCFENWIDAMFIFFTCCEQQDPSGPYPPYPPSTVPVSPVEPKKAGLRPKNSSHAVKTYEPKWVSQMMLRTVCFFYENVQTKIWGDFPKHEVSYHMNLSEKPCVLQRPILAQTGTKFGLITQ